jgi:hypothetical protein
MKMQSFNTALLNNCIRVLGVCNGLSDVPLHPLERVLETHLLMGNWVLLTAIAANAQAHGMPSLTPVYTL